MRKVLLAGLGLALLLALGFRWWRLASPDSEVPEIATESLHPLVAEAMNATREEVLNAPRSATAWGEYGMALLAHDFREVARQCLTEAMRLDPDEFRWPYFIGYSLEGDDFDAAVTFYEQALLLRPDYNPLRIRLAHILMRLGALDRAEAVLSAGREQEPENPYLLVTAGRLAMVQGDVEQAQAFFEEATQQPNFMPLSAYLELIKLANRAGDYQQAYEYQQRMAGLPPVAKLEFPDPMLQGIRRFEGLSKTLAERADRALARGDFSSAITAYEAFVRKRPDLPTARVNLAQAYALAGRMPKAIETYRSILDEFGDVVAARFGLAGTHEQMGNVDEAIKEYRAVLETKPDHKQAWFLLGLLHEQQGDRDDAIRCYREATRIDPSFAQPQLALGVALLKKGDLEAAREPIERAVELRPGDPVPTGYLKELERAASPSGNE